MEFELEYQLKDFREIQDQYFDEDNKCYNRHILSTDIAEKMLNLIDKLSERVNELEPVIKQQIKKSLTIHDVVVCSREDCTDLIYSDSIYCLDHAYKHKMEGY